MALLVPPYRRLLSVVVVVCAAVSTGCYEEQTPECQRYVECFDAFNAETGLGDANLMATFRFDGTCWNSPTTADECTEICAYDINCLRAEFTARGLDIPAACPEGVTNGNGDPVVDQCAP